MKVDPVVFACYFMLACKLEIMIPLIARIGRCKWPGVNYDAETVGKLYHYASDGEYEMPDSQQLVDKVEVMLETIERMVDGFEASRPFQAIYMDLLKYLVEQKISPMNEEKAIKFLEIPLGQYIELAPHGTRWKERIADGER